MTRAVCVSRHGPNLSKISLFPVYIEAFPVLRLTPAGVSCFVHLMSQMGRRHAGIYLTNLEWFGHYAICGVFYLNGSRQHCILNFQLGQPQWESKPWHCWCSFVATELHSMSLPFTPKMVQHSLSIHLL